MSKETAKTVMIGHIEVPVSLTPRIQKVKAFLQMTTKDNEPMITRKRDVVYTCFMKGIESFEKEMDRYIQK